MSASLYVSIQCKGDIDLTKDILYETKLYYNILKYGLYNKQLSPNWLSFISMCFLARKNNSKKAL
jgi:hypothetical protein